MYPCRLKASKRRRLNCESPRGVRERSSERDAEPYRSTLWMSVKDETCRGIGGAAEHEQTVIESHAQRPRNVNFQSTAEIATRDLS